MHRGNHGWYIGQLIRDLCLLTNAKKRGEFFLKMLKQKKHTRAEVWKWIFTFFHKDSTQRRPEREKRSRSINLFSHQYSCTGLCIIGCRKRIYFQAFSAAVVISQIFFYMSIKLHVPIQSSIKYENKIVHREEKNNDPCKILNHFPSLKILLPAVSEINLEHFYCTFFVRLCGNGFWVRQNFEASFQWGNFHSEVSWTW